MFFRDLQLSIAGYQKALALASKHSKLMKLLLLSSACYLLLILLGGWGIIEGASSFNNFLNHTAGMRFLDKYSALKWLHAVVKFTLYVSALFVYISFFKYLLLTIASPLYAYISESTYLVLSGNDVPFNLNQLIKDVVRGVRISIRNLIKQLLLTLLLLVLSFIPLIGLISPLLMILLDSYYYGFAMLDYNCERERLDVRNSLYAISSRKGLAIGNGVVFYFLFFIPVIGVAIGAPLSAMAAAISWHERGK